MKNINIAFFGGSFNPPHEGHKRIVKYLLADSSLDTVIVKPSGIRKDKPLSSENIYLRKKMIEDFFEEFKCNRFMLNTDSIDLPIIPTYLECNKLREYCSPCNVWIVVGTDLLECNKQGRCEIHSWVNGEQLLKEESFYIFPRNRSDYNNPYNIIHLRSSLWVVRGFEPIDISSTQLRNLKENKINV